MEDQHTDFVQTEQGIVQAAAIPPAITKRPEALELYRVAVYALSAIGAVGLLGVLVLAGLGRAVPGEAIVLASVAVGALAGMVGGEAVSRG
jgi:hypothetical protein